MRLKRVRQPAVRPWFSPLMSWTMTEPAQDVLGTLVSDVGPAELAEQQPGRPQQAGGANLLLGRPPGGAVGIGLLGFPRPPHRHGNRNDNRGEPAGRGDVGSRLENVRRIGVVREPPPEESRWMIDGVATRHEPRVAELGLVAELRGRPLRRGPDKG